MRSPLRHLKKTGTEFITEGVDDPAANQQLAEARPYTAKALQQIYRPGYLIDPRHSKVMGSWDIIMLVALMFTAIVTPYEVTFIEEGPCVTILFMVNRFIDLLFLMDMCAAKLWRARSLLPSIHTCYCVRPLLVHTLSFLPTPGTPGTPGSIVTRTLLFNYDALTAASSSTSPIKSRPAFGSTRARPSPCAMRPVSS
jgi:hypothetical protein